MEHSLLCAPSTMSSGFWKIFAGWSLTVAHLCPIISRHRFICTRTPCTGWGCAPSVELGKPSPRQSVWMKRWPQHSGLATAHARTQFLNPDQLMLHAAPCSCLHTPCGCLSVTWNPKKKVLGYWRCPKDSSLSTHNVPDTGLGSRIEQWTRRQGLCHHRQGQKTESTNKQTKIWKCQAVRRKNKVIWRHKTQRVGVVKEGLLEEVPSQLRNWVIRN